MIQASPFLQELKEAASRGSAERRLKALWHATDLLIDGSYSEDQIWLFGEVIALLADEIEVTARSMLSNRLASSNNAPINIIQQLASDESIEVAGPVLQWSNRIGIGTLVATAQSKGQKHLLAISRRNFIAEQVTDVLVARGNKAVVTFIATNNGARFTETGLLRLLKRSETDDILTEHLGRRKDIPRHIFQQLIASASDNVRRKLASERPEFGAEIDTLVADVAGELHSKFAPAPKNNFAARRNVVAQYQAGQLNEKRLFDYAQRHQFNETIIALSLLCELPVDVVERAVVDANPDTLLVLAKALDLSWTTTMLLLFLGAADHR
ncbi:MAG TPA: DUF2336 domain-containing protein, partial [Anaerolineae bacterium]